MCQSDHIREFLEKNGLFDSCNGALKEFRENPKFEKCHYSAFRRIYIKFEPSSSGVTVLKPGAVRMREDFTTKTVGDSNDISYEIWAKTPIQHQPDERHTGAVVWVAGTPRREKHLLVSTHKKGDPQWPTCDGYVIEDHITRRKRYLERRSVRLHPDTYKKTRKKSKK